MLYIYIDTHLCVILNQGTNMGKVFLLFVRVYNSAKYDQFFVNKTLACKRKLRGKIRCQAFRSCESNRVVQLSFLCIGKWSKFSRLIIQNVKILRTITWVTLRNDDQICHLIYLLLSFLYACFYRVKIQKLWRERKSDKIVI